MDQRPLSWAAHRVREDGFWDWARRIDEAARLIDERDCAEACFALVNTMRGYQDALCDAGEHYDSDSAGWAIRMACGVRRCIESLSMARWEHDDESEQDCGGAVRAKPLSDGVLQQGKDLAIPAGEFGGNR